MLHCVHQLVSVCLSVCVFRVLFNIFSLCCVMYTSRGHFFRSSSHPVCVYDHSNPFKVRQTSYIFQKSSQKREDTCNVSLTLADQFSQMNKQKSHPEITRGIMGLEITRIVFYCVYFLLQRDKNTFPALMGQLSSVGLMRLQLKIRRLSKTGTFTVM